MCATLAAALVKLEYTGYPVSLILVRFSSVAICAIKRLLERASMTVPRGVWSHTFHWEISPF